jgi:hypothetical protein
MGRKHMPTYTLRISHTPALGKGPALRAALEAHTKASNAAGGGYGLQQRLYASESAFVNLIQFDGLAALDADRAASPNDPARQARIAKINECLGRPQSTALFEGLVPNAATTPPAYVMRVNFTPALGKGPELRKVLEERVRAGTQKGSLATGLGTQVAPEDGVSFWINILFANLAGLEEFRAANQSDPSFQAFQTRLAGLIAAQPRQELSAVLVPLRAK